MYAYRIIYAKENRNAVAKETLNLLKKYASISYIMVQNMLNGFNNERVYHVGVL